MVELLHLLDPIHEVTRLCLIEGKESLGMIEPLVLVGVLEHSTLIKPKVLVPLKSSQTQMLPFLGYLVLLSRLMALPPRFINHLFQITVVLWR